jgi:hypothetical protein
MDCSSTFRRHRRSLGAALLGSAAVALLIAAVVSWAT